MENLRIFLKLQRRKNRRQLIWFVEVVLLQVSAGYDLSFAWEEAEKYLGDYKKQDPLLQLCFDNKKGGMTKKLETLSQNYPYPAYGVWFSLLKDLYLQGASLVPALTAFSQTLSKEELRDWDDHCRRLPSRLNLGLLFFFLPVAMLLWFYPLVIGIIKQF